MAQLHEQKLSPMSPRDLWSHFLAQCKQVSNIILATGVDAQSVSYLISCIMQSNISSVFSGLIINPVFQESEAHTERLGHLPRTGRTVASSWGALIQFHFYLEWHVVPGFRLLGVWLIEHSSAAPKLPILKEGKKKKHYFPEPTPTAKVAQKWASSRDIPDLCREW
jgi:hypothetical protein